MVTYRCLEKKLDAFHQWCLRRLFQLSYLRHVTYVEVLRLTRQMQLSTTLRDRRLRLVISRGPTAEWIIHVLFDPLFLDCHAIGNDLPGDHNELGFVQMNRTCGHSTSAWCQLGNELRIVNGGSGQWKRLRCRMGHALDDDDEISIGHVEGRKR